MKQPIDNLLGKMTMVIGHARFHNIPYASPLEENLDPNVIIQRLLEQC